MSGKGKKAKNQKKTALESLSVVSSSVSSYSIASSSSSFSSSYSSSLPTAPLKTQVSHFDQHFPVVQFLAQAIEPVVNMKVYAHGSWCAIEKVLQDGYVTPEQRVYFEKHLKEKGDVDVIVLFDDNETREKCSPAQLQKNEEIIYEALSSRQDCSISRVAWEKNKIKGKYYKFQFTHGQADYDLDLATCESNDHSLSPASVMYDKNRTKMFGSRDDHFKRHQRFLSHHEISMPGLGECKPLDKMDNTEKIRRICFALKTASFYIDSSKSNGYYLDKATIELLQGFRKNKYYWDEIKEYYKSIYVKNERVSQESGITLEKIMEVSKGRDMVCLRERQAWLSRIWDETRKKFALTLYWIDEINIIKKNRVIEYPFSEEVIEACQPQPTSEVSYDIQVEMLFNKIQVLKEIESKIEHHCQYYAEIYRELTEIVESSNSSPELSAISSNHSTTTNSSAESESSFSGSKTKKKAKKKVENKKEKEEDDFDFLIQKAMESNALELKKKESIVDTVKNKIYGYIYGSASNDIPSELTEKSMINALKKTNENVQPKVVQDVFKEMHHQIELSKILVNALNDDEKEGTEQLYYALINALVQESNKLIPDTRSASGTSEFNLSDIYFHGLSGNQKRMKLITEWIGDLSKNRTPGDRAVLIEWFTQECGKYRIIIRTNLFLDPLTHFKDFKACQENALESRVLMEKFLKQYNKKKHDNLVSDYILFSEKQHSTQENRMRAFMFILLVLLDHCAVDYGDCIEIYVDYVNKIGVDNDCFTKRADDIAYVKSALKKMCSANSTVSRFDLIKSVVQQCAEGKERRVSADRIICAVFEEIQTIADSYETFERLMPEVFRTGMYYHETDRDQHMMTHPGSVTRSLTLFLMSNSLFPAPKTVDDQLVSMIAYLKGIFITAERKFFCMRTVQSERSTHINRYKYFYFLLCEIYVKKYFVGLSFLEIRDSMQHDESVSKIVSQFVQRNPTYLQVAFEGWRDASTELIKAVHEQFPKYDLNRLRMHLSAHINERRILISWFDLCLIHYNLTAIQTFSEKEVVYPQTHPTLVRDNQMVAWVHTAAKQDNKTVFFEQEIYAENSHAIFKRKYHEIGARISPFTYSKRFLEDQTYFELHQFVETLYVFSFLLMMYAKRNGTLSVMTFCHEYLNSLESFAMNHYYQQKFKNKKTHIKDVETLLNKANNMKYVFNISFSKLTAISKQLPTEDMRKAVALLTEESATKDSAHVLQCKNLLFAYAIAIVYMNDWTKNSSKIVDMTNLYYPYDLIPSVNLFKALNLVVHHDFYHVNITQSTLMMDIFAAHLNFVDKNWSPLSASNSEIQTVLEKMSNFNNEKLKRFIWDPSAFRSVKIKQAIMLVKSKPQLSAMFPAALVERMLKYPPRISPQEAKELDKMLTDSGIEFRKDASANDCYLWAGDLTCAIYLLKVDELVRLPISAFTERSEHLWIIKSLLEHSNRLKALGGASSSGSSQEMHLVAAPTAESLPQTPKPSSAYQTSQGKTSAKI